MIRTTVLGLVSAVALIASANAADIYRNEGGSLKDAPAYYPVNTWAGFYAGVNGGYGWQANNESGDVLKPEGGFGGGQVGYNWQRDHFVFGIEADIQGSGISDKATITDGRVSITGRSDLNYFGTVRGRIGYDFGRTLIYATGGFAYGEVENKVSLSVARFGSISGSASDTQTGYVLGGGIEYKIAPAWSLKGEYQYINLDASDSNAGNLGLNGKSDSELHTVRVGLNYHFGNTYEPLK